MPGSAAFKWYVSRVSPSAAAGEEDEGGDNGAGEDSNTKKRSRQDFTRLPSLRM